MSMMSGGSGSSLGLGNQSQCQQQQEEEETAEDEKKEEERSNTDSGSKLEGMSGGQGALIPYSPIIGRMGLDIAWNWKWSSGNHLQSAYRQTCDQCQIQAHPAGHIKSNSNSNSDINKNTTETTLAKPISGSLGSIFDQFSRKSIPDHISSTFLPGLNTKSVTSQQQQNQQQKTKDKSKEDGQEWEVDKRQSSNLVLKRSSNKMRKKRLDLHLQGSSSNPALSFSRLRVNATEPDPGSDCDCDCTATEDKTSTFTNNTKHAEKDFRSIPAKEEKQDAVDLDLHQGSSNSPQDGLESAALSTCPSQDQDVHQEENEGSSQDGSSSRGQQNHDDGPVQDELLSSSVKLSSDNEVPPVNLTLSQRLLKKRDKSKSPVALHPPVVLKHIAKRHRQGHTPKNSPDPEERNCPKEDKPNSYKSGCRKVAKKTGEKAAVKRRELCRKVMKKILEYSDLHTIFTLRLLSKRWNDLCLTRLGHLRFVYQVSLKSSAQVQNFLDNIASKNLSIFTSFALEQVAIRPGTPVKQLFNLFGERMTSLDLKHEVVIWMDRFRELISQVPNLQSLSIGITRFRGSRIFVDVEKEMESKMKPQEGVVVAMAVDLNANPTVDVESSSKRSGAEKATSSKELFLGKLKVVNFYGGGGTFSFQPFFEDFFRIAPNVEIIRADPGDLPMMSKDFREKLIRGTLARRLPRLDKFDFELHLSEDMCKRLAHAQYALREMILIVKEDLIRSEILFKLLRYFGSSLQFLHLTFEINQATGRKQMFRIPPFKALQMLTLVNFYGGVSGFSFLPKCSRLKYLDVLAVPNFETMLPTGKETTVVEGLEEIRMTAIAYRSSFAFHQILALFPRIVRLVLDEVQDNSLRAVFLELPHLVRLTLKGNFSDEGITGIPLEKCEEIRACQSLYRVRPEGLRHSVFLGDLKKLEWLHLESNFITDVSIHLAVVLCPNITHLTLASEAVTDMTLITIANRMTKLVWVDISQCCLLSSDIKQLVRSALSTKFLLLCNCNDSPKDDTTMIMTKSGLRRRVKSRSSPMEMVGADNVDSGPAPLEKTQSLKGPSFVIERLVQGAGSGTGGDGEWRRVRAFYDHSDKMKMENRYLKSISRQLGETSNISAKTSQGGEIAVASAPEPVVPVESETSQLLDGNGNLQESSPFVKYILDKPELLSKFGRFVPPPSVKLSSSPKNKANKNCKSRNTPNCNT